MSLERNRRFVSSRLGNVHGWNDASRRRARVNMATTMTTTTGIAALTRAKSSAMVMNMLRVAMYTVTHCRGVFFGWNDVDANANVSAGKTTD